MNNTLPKIQNIQKELIELSTKRNFEQVKRVILSVVKLLDEGISENDLNLFQLFTDVGNSIVGVSLYLFKSFALSFL